MKYVLILTITYILYITSINSQSEADTDRKTKVMACINLVKSSLFHDKDYFEEVVKNITAEDKTELISSFVTKSVLNCYNTVSLIKSADLLSKSYEKLNPFYKDTKEILDIKNYYNKYKNNEEKLKKDQDRIEKILKETKDEVTALYDLTKKAADDLFPGDTYEILRQQQTRKASEKLREDENIDYNYEGGNLNLSFLTKMDPKIRFGIGFLLILTIFFALFLALKRLRTKKLNDSKKKKIINY